MNNIVFESRELRGVYSPISDDDYSYVRLDGTYWVCLDDDVLYVLTNCEFSDDDNPNWRPGLSLELLNPVMSYDLNTWDNDGPTS